MYDRVGRSGVVLWPYWSNWMDMPTPAMRETSFWARIDTPSRISPYARSSWMKTMRSLSGNAGSVGKIGAKLSGLPLKQGDFWSYDVLPTNEAGFISGARLVQGKESRPILFFWHMHSPFSLHAIGYNEVSTVHLIEVVLLEGETSLVSWCVHTKNEVSVRSMSNKRVNSTSVIFLAILFGKNSTVLIANQPKRKTFF